jgi:hypothetical protein
MKPDDFEKRLQSQSLCKIPSEWRDEILQTAKSATYSPFAIRHWSLSTLHHRLSTILWPHPKAWAGLAAVWLVITIAYLAAGDTTTQVAKKSPPPTPESLVILQQQQRLLAELVGPPAPRNVDRPKSNATSPRSERRTETAIA